MKIFPINISGLSIRSKTHARKYFASLLSQYDIGSIVSQDHAEQIIAILNLSESSLAFEVGDVFSIRKDNGVVNTPCFWATMRTGESFSIPLRRVIDGMPSIAPSPFETHGNPSTTRVQGVSDLCANDIEPKLNNKLEVEISVSEFIAFAEQAISEIWHEEHDRVFDEKCNFNAQVVCAASNRWLMFSESVMKASPKTSLVAESFYSAHHGLMNKNNLECGLLKSEFVNFYRTNVTYSFVAKESHRLRVTV